jgi:DNA gyrase, A subunit
MNEEKEIEIEDIEEITEERPTGGKDSLINMNIVKEMQDSFIDYSMSVIISRALPDLRDGLKPVHRRILYSMYESGFTPDKQFRKCARAVGDIMGKYHPHGDSSIYDAMVRMAQSFNYRKMLVEGQGNFGNIDGDGAAAMRYTEARLAKISMEMLRDIGKNTVNFKANFDNNETEPDVLPSRFPNVLVNGTMGIAVGMATNIPPHNLGEVIDGCVSYIDNHEVTVEDLMMHIKGPDFPTGGSILGNSGIKKAYETGKGTIVIRSTANIEETKGSSQIVITDIPYQVNKRNLIQKIAELHRDKIIDGITDLTDESNLENGIRVVVSLRKDANANVVLNNLYKHTQLQTSYGINLLMIDQGQPRTLGLKDIISKYIDYQKEVIIRRTKFDLEKAEKRVHILNGLKIALDNIDDIIKIIKESNEDTEIIAEFEKRYGLTEIQSQAILEMKLRRLSGLERGKIEAELAELLERIEKLKTILSSEKNILEVIKQELLEIKNKYSDERRTNIDMTAIDYIEDEALIPVEDIVITLTNKGYIKRITSETYKTQNRGGVGIKGMATNEEDFVENLISMTTHDYILFFTNKGKVYRMKGYEVPLFSRQSKGLPIVNLLPVEKDEVIKAMLKVKNEDESKNIVFCTQNGLVKRTAIEEFDSIRNGGKIAITLKDGDELLAVKKTKGDEEILIASSNGRMIHFKEEEIRVMGRTASGVRGIDVGDGITVGCEIAKPGQEVLVVTENGFGKRTDVDAYRLTHRGSKGVKALNITEKNGNIVAFKTVHGDEDLMIITDSGIVIRLLIEQVSTTGRVAQGVKLINLKDNQKVSTVATIKKDLEEDSITEEKNESEIIIEEEN